MAYCNFILIQLTVSEPTIRTMNVYSFIITKSGDIYLEASLNGFDMGCSIAGDFYPSRKYIRKKNKVWHSPSQKDNYRKINNNYFYLQSYEIDKPPYLIDCMVVTFTTPLDGLIIKKKYMIINLIDNKLTRIKNAEFENKIFDFLFLKNSTQ
jgi:hypothetical protein